MPSHPAWRPALRAASLIAVAFACSLVSAWPASAADLRPALAVLQGVRNEGLDNRSASQAWLVVAQAPASQLPEMLSALDEANPLGANWIRAAVDTVADRTLRSEGKLPAAELEAFVRDVRHDPRARRLAYEWLSRSDAAAADRLIPGMLHDPGTEFRRDAVARLLSEAAAKLDGDEPPAARLLYREALSGAVDHDQVELIAERLSGLGEDVDLPRHFGYLMQWKLIGPFDNTDESGYAVAYPPEREQDLAASYPGKSGTVAWIDLSTSAKDGEVDLNQALGKTPGAIAYAYTQFICDDQREVDLRLTSPNATKVWVNGRLVDEHEVYHAGSQFDQYIARAILEPGTNHILIKICQNERTEDWAQVWSFRFRVTDAVGSAILSADRR